VIGGLLFATPTTLLIVPYLFAMLRKGNDESLTMAYSRKCPNDQMRALPKNQDAQDQPDPETDRVVALKSPVRKRRGTRRAARRRRAAVAQGVLQWEAGATTRPARRRGTAQQRKLVPDVAWLPSAPVTANYGHLPRPRRRLRREYFRARQRLYRKALRRHRRSGQAGACWRTLPRRTRPSD